jgi:hypothetical protein
MPCSLILTFNTTRIILHTEYLYERLHDGAETRLLQGSLDMLVLKALALGPLHGWACRSGASGHDAYHMSIPWFG